MLGFFIAEWLFRCYTHYSEGDLTRLRAHLVRQDTLAGIAREVDLGAHMSLGAGELKTGGDQRVSILADALEALIAAVYLAGGLDRARKFVMDLYSTRLDNLPSLDQLKDAKTKLQEFLQARGLELPRYVLQKQIRKSGDEALQPSNCSFRVAVNSSLSTGKNPVVCARNRMPLNWH